MCVCNFEANVLETKGDSAMFLLGTYRKVPKASQMVTWPITS